MIGEKIIRIIFDQSTILPNLSSPVVLGDVSSDGKIPIRTKVTSHTHTGGKEEGGKEEGGGGMM